MGEAEHRQIARDSLFVMAELRLDGIESTQKVKVRNLSTGGLMAEGISGVERGQLGAIELRNLGWVEGSVAWVQGNRCGFAFRNEIDPKIARSHQTSATEPNYVLRRPAGALASPSETGLLRKI